MTAWNRAEIDPGWLRRRYLDDDAPIGHIADEVGVDPATLHRHLAAAEIPLRGKAGSRRAPTIDQEWLKARRGEGASWHAIAAELHIDRSAVIWQAAGYGLWQVPDGLQATAAVAAQRYRSGESLRSIGLPLDQTAGR